jgi:type IX secretion system PorP/SprF family membrane protein
MKKNILTLLLSAVAFSARAQDVHFSQYFSSPLTLNPALTGLLDGTYRVAANYRSQWASVSGNPYLTGTISYDMALLKQKLPEGDAIGMGIMGLYDKAGDGGLINTTVGLSLAYHHAFGFDKQHLVSLGAQAYMVQKSLDFNKLRFADQYDRFTGIQQYQTKEPFGSADIQYPDFNAGLMYNGKLSEKAAVYFGFSYYHLTQPVETFLSGTNTIHSRETIYLGASLNLSDRVAIYYSGLYQQQGFAQETLMGMAFGYALDNTSGDLKATELLLGTWYRFGDALVPYLALKYQKIQMGFSYDVNISGFTAATNGAGAYELSLIYIGNIKFDEGSARHSNNCPRF